jgi:cytoskeletal protein RodZ
MQIASITPVVHPPSISNPALVALLPYGASTAASLPAVAARSTASAAVERPAPHATAAPAPTAATPASGAQNATSAASRALIVEGFSTTVNGTHYSSSVHESGGVYTATVPTIPVVAASGPTITAAENNLNLRIDVLV